MIRVVTQLVAYPVKKTSPLRGFVFFGPALLVMLYKIQPQDVRMDNETATQHIEERAEAVAEEILMLYVMDGMKAKEEVKQLMIQFASQATRLH